MRRVQGLKLATVFFQLAAIFDIAAAQIAAPPRPLRIPPLLRYDLCGNTSLTSGCNGSSTSTTVGDSSGNGNSGTISGMGSGFSYVAGITAPYALSLVNQDVTFASTVTLSGDFTLAAWFKSPDSLSNADMIFSDPAHGANTNFYAGQYRLYNGGCGGDLIVDATVTPSNTWVQLTITRKAGALALYHNGVLTRTTASSSCTLTTFTFVELAEAGGGATEVLNSVRIYGQALTATQVMGLYAQGATPTGPVS